MLDSPPQPLLEDEVDQLLRDYFRAQLPQHWPPPPLPVERLDTTPSHYKSGRSVVPIKDSLRQSRYALAASVAVLFVCGWLLIGPSSDTATITPHGSSSGWPAGDVLRHSEAGQPPILQHLRQIPPSSPPSPSTVDTKTAQPSSNPSPSSIKLP